MIVIMMVHADFDSTGRPDIKDCMLVKFGDLQMNWGKGAWVRSTWKRADRSTKRMDHSTSAGTPVQSTNPTSLPGACTVRIQ